MLPPDFISYTSALFGDTRWQQYFNAFSETAPVSIRLNPFKTPSNSNSQLSTLNFQLNQPVPWSRNAYYLSERPNFTLDPLFHAGAYYVQEASSMFLDHVLSSQLSSELCSPEHQRSARTFNSQLVLDLCAAPGGKSTLLRATLPSEALLYSNEPDRKRANILMENMQKQGHPNVVVTNNYPRDYQRSGLLFDMILADVPCSGEGMFRKDPKTISEWSIDNVLKCQQLQRSIIQDIWSCLKPGGILIYSTCTFNTRENEENIQWIIDNFKAEVLTIPVNLDWHIQGSLLSGFDYPVYRFIPGITRGEGLFMCVLQKRGEEHLDSSLSSESSIVNCQSSIINYQPIKNASHFSILHDGRSISPTIKGKKVIPAHAESLLISTPRDKYPRVELSLDSALNYLRHEALSLPPDTPRGYVIVTYKDLPLGFVNNIGTRANNLYPKEWKIRNL